MADKDIEKVQYRDASPWDVLTKPSPCSSSSDLMRTASGNVTQAAVLLAMRSMKDATPTKVAEELGSPLQEVSSLLYSMWRHKQVDRKAVRVKGKSGFRATFEYCIRKTQ